MLGNNNMRSNMETQVIWLSFIKEAEFLIYMYLIKNIKTKYKKQSITQTLIMFSNKFKFISG